MSESEIQTLKGEIVVRKDDDFETLNFTTKQGAEAFAHLCHLYQDESGAGNGYGAYWHLRDSPIAAVDTPRGNANLDSSRVNYMLESIVSARLAGGEVQPLSKDEILKLAVKDGLIEFNFTSANLPPRIIPKAGDLVRIIDHPEFSRSVLARLDTVIDDKAHVAPCEYGIIEPMVVPLNNVMKVRDFLSRT